MDISQSCVKSYNKHKNLKIVGKELGIPWQTVYVHLKKLGVSVTGDKLRYGSTSDRLAALSERKFIELVPSAVDQNRKKFQSKIDFLVNGYGVDVKCASPKTVGKSEVTSWAFSVKKQEVLADFFVCFALSENAEILHTLLIPGEIVRHYSTIRISNGKRSLGGKWWDFEVDKNDLDVFFVELGPNRKALE